MEWLIASGLAVCALGFALVRGLPRSRWRDMPRYLVRMVMAAGCVFLVFGIYLAGVGACQVSHSASCGSLLASWDLTKGFWPWLYAALAALFVSGSALAVQGHWFWFYYGLLVGFAVVLGTIAVRQRSGAAAQPPTLEKTVYVGRMVVLIDELAQRKRITIALTCFNASTAAIGANVVHGSIGYIENGVDKGALPTPRLDDGHLDDIAGFTEFVMNLRQELPNDIAQSMARVFSRREKIQFNLSSLDIYISSIVNPEQMGRLQLWDALGCEQFSDKIRTSRVKRISAPAGNGRSPLPA
ncbi:MAG: hypothetical protein ACHQF3_07090 [Alphaproteobacteria bacterium]